MSLTSELSTRNRILEQIKETQDIISGESNKVLLGKISGAKNVRSSILTEFKDKQNQIRRESSISNLVRIEQELIVLCGDLSDIENKIKMLTDELKSIRTIGDIGSQQKLDNLLEQLRINTENISNEREKERLKVESEIKNNKYKGLTGFNDPGLSDSQRVWIDENFGIFIDYPKKQVISDSVNQLFGPTNAPNVPKVNDQGVTTLLNMFIDVLLKAIGQGFAKPFFTFKNTIDMLAGMDLGKLLGTYIPALPKIISDITLLLSNPQAWMFKKMLGPLFDINIPIKSFNFDLGALIPILPFGVRIPTIDPYGFLTKNTPFNINADQSKVPSDWKEQIMADVDKKQKDYETNFNNIRNNKIKELNDKIKKLTNELNKINKYTAQREKSDKNLKTLLLKEQQLRDEINNNKNSDDVEYFLNKEKELIDICIQLETEKNKNIQLLDLESKEQIRLDNIEIDPNTKDLLQKLNDDKKDLSEQPTVTFKDFAKRSVILAYDQNISQDELPEKLSRLWDIGVNIFDNEVTEYLQKIGHNLTNDDHVNKLLNLKEKYGFTFSNALMLKRLYELGFNINDPSHLQKLGFLRSFNIDVKDTELMLLLTELGLNFNNINFKYTIDSNLLNSDSKNYYDPENIKRVSETSIFGNDINIFNELNKLSIKMNDIEILKKLNTMGFNFNNPYMLHRLIVLSNYVDLSKGSGYDNALAKNVNLNNPYFEDVLRKYSRIGLTWNSDNFAETEAEILKEVTVSDVNSLLRVVNQYKKGNKIKLFNYISESGSDAEEPIVQLNIFSSNLQISQDNLVLEELYYPETESTIYRGYGSDPYPKDGWGVNRSHYKWGLNNLLPYDEFLGYPRNTQWVYNDGFWKKIISDPDYNNMYVEGSRLYLFGTSIDIIQVTSVTNDFEQNLTGVVATINPVNNYYTGATFTITHNLNLIEEPIVEVFSISSGVVIPQATGYTSLGYLINVISNDVIEIYFPTQSVPNNVYFVTIGGITMTETVVTRDDFKKLQWKNIFDIDICTTSDILPLSNINKYEKYGIKLDKTILDDVYIGNSVKRKYLYPNNTLFNQELIGEESEIEAKLKLMLDFVINGGWKINGIRVADNIGELDYQRIVDASGDYNLTAVTSSNPNDGEISYDQLQGLYGNFDKLGLNVRDPEFSKKILDLTSKLKIKVDETNILDTKTNVTLTYYDDINIPGSAKHEVNLNNNKVNPNIYEDEKYNPSIKITNVINPNLKKQPTKTIVQFNSLNKLGFNFQQPSYNEFLIKLYGLSFDISRIESVDIVDSISSIGWHWTNGSITSREKLDKLISFGFNFELPPDIELTGNESVETFEELNGKNMSNKLNLLNEMGFNFNRDDWHKLLEYLTTLGFNLKNFDFERAIEEINGFGINFNDLDWMDKMNKFISLGINFSSLTNGKKDWIAKMSNLSMLGIDFNDSNWLNKYNEAINFKTLGIDYNDVNNKQKIAILNKLGVDFTKPKDEYMDKLESLVKLKLIYIPAEVEKTKVDFLRERSEKLSVINSRILYLQKILSGELILEIDNKIKKLKNIQLQLISELSLTKITNVNEMSVDELNTLSKRQDKICSDTQKTNDDINKLLLERKKISKLNKNDIETELAKLKDDKTKLEDIKIYNYNKNITLAEVEKFKGLEKLGINYYDPNWNKHVDLLIDNKFNFGLVDWMILLPALLTLIPKNPILAWTKTLVDAITTLITLPLKILIKIITKFLDLLKSVIKIPLNPLKISKWGVGIIKKFNALVKMLVAIPTMIGMMDLLFKSADGLMMIDGFVPGYAAFMTKLDSIVAGSNSKAKSLKSTNKNKKLELNKTLDLKAQKSRELNAKIKIGTGDKSDVLALNKKLENQIKIHTNNIELLKGLTNTDLSEKALLDIEKELILNCEKIEELKKEIERNNELLNKPLSENELSTLNNELNNLDNTYDTFTLQNDITKNEIEIKNLTENAEALGNYCTGDTDKIIQILKGIIDVEKNKPNPFDDQIKSKEEKINKLKKIIEINKNTINNTKNNTIDTKSINNLNKEILDIKKQIKLIEDDLCENRLNMTDSEFESKMKKLSQLTKLLEDKQKDLKNLKSPTEEKINNLLNKNLELDAEILKTQKEMNGLKDKQSEFNVNKIQNLLNLDNVAKWFPVIKNILCGLPKTIVNIFVGILNSIGSMKNLPPLWNFDLVN